MIPLNYFLYLQALSSLSVDKAVPYFPFFFFRTWWWELEMPPKWLVLFKIGRHARCAVDNSLGKELFDGLASLFLWFCSVLLVLLLSFFPLWYTSLMVPGGFLTVDNLFFFVGTLQVACPNRGLPWLCSPYSTLPFFSLHHCVKWMSGNLFFVIRQLLSAQKALFSPWNNCIFDRENQTDLQNWH